MDQEEQIKPQKISIITRTKDLLNGWVGKTILLPFVVTRLLWLAVGLFSKNFLANPTYDQYSSRGWMLSPHFLIDIWTRWDSKWYLSIAENGYTPAADLSSTISNVAFFPLYPYLVRFFNLLLPGFLRSRSVTLLIGLLISNLAFLLAAVLIYRLVRDLFKEKKLAERTLLLIFVFPTSYYFSTFYSEALFLLLAVSCFTAANKKRWLLAGVFSALLALTRPQGILIALPLAVLYMQERDWKFNAIHADVLALALPLPFLLAHSFYLDNLAQQSLVLVKAQMAWGRMPGGFFQNLWLQVGAPVLDIFKFDLGFLVLFLASSGFLMFKRKTLAYGIFSFLLLFMPFATGSVVSVTRFCLAGFPVFFFWASRLKNEKVFTIVCAFLFTFQVLFFLAWSNYYWIA